MTRVSLACATLSLITPKEEIIPFFQALALTPGKTDVCELYLELADKVGRRVGSCVHGHFVRFIDAWREGKGWGKRSYLRLDASVRALPVKKEWTGAPLRVEVCWMPCLGCSLVQTFF
jgi:hypothetical protein